MAREHKFVISADYRLFDKVMEDISLHGATYDYDDKNKVVVKLKATWAMMEYVVCQILYAGECKDPGDTITVAMDQKHALTVWRREYVLAPTAENHLLKREERWSVAPDPKVVMYHRVTGPARIIQARYRDDVPRNGFWDELIQYYLRGRRVHDFGDLIGASQRHIIEHAQWLLSQHDIHNPHRALIGVLCELRSAGAIKFPMEFIENLNMLEPL